MEEECVSILNIPEEYTTEDLEKWLTNAFELKDEKLVDFVKVERDLDPSCAHAYFKDKACMKRCVEQDHLVYFY
jgi:hypothetical protein